MNGILMKKRKMGRRNYQIVPLNKEKDSEILLRIRINEIWRFDLPFEEKKKMIEDEEDEFYMDFYNNGDTFLIPATVKRRWRK